MALIRITRMPPGEAPAEIRAAWVGLVLPLKYARPRRHLASGVVPGPRGPWHTLLHLLTFRLHVEVGYVVPAYDAVAPLTEARPDAARWWHDHAAHNTRPGRCFLFPRDCWEEVP